MIRAMAIATVLAMMGCTTKKQESSDAGVLLPVDAGATDAGHAQVDAGPQIINCWAGDGNGIDAIGGNDATLNTGVSFGPGRSGQAFVCDGTEGPGHDVDTSELPALSGTGNWTYDFWIKYTSAGPDTWVLDRQWHNNPNSTGTPLVSFHMGDQGAASWTIRGTDFATAASLSGFTLSAGAWTHIAVTRSGDVFTAYVNGTQVATATDLAGPTHDIQPDPPRWCGHPDTTGVAFTGSIDSIRIWNGALTSSQIASIAKGDGSCAAK